MDQKPLSKRKQRLERNKWADMNVAAVMECRRIAKEALGMNFSFVDDDISFVVGLAQRAILAGLITDLDGDMQHKLADHAEQFRERHEQAIGRAI